MDKSWSRQYSNNHDLVRYGQTHGGVAEVCQEAFAGLTLPYLKVKSTWGAMYALAEENRRRLNGQLIAITGSVGKTTTKEMLKNLLGHAWLIDSSHNKLNNARGFMSNLAQTNPNVDYAIYEFGMAQIGSIKFKSKLGKPNLAIITEIQPDHLMHHENLESIANTKAEIFLGMKADSTVILNRDMPYFELLEQKAKAQDIHRILSYGQHPKADFRLLNYQLSSQGSVVDIEWKHKTYRQHLHYSLQAMGLSSIYNSLASLTTLYALGLNPKPYAPMLHNFQLPDQRGEQISIVYQGKKLLVLDQRYNANLASIKACAEHLILAANKAGLGQFNQHYIYNAAMPSCKSTLILGDMELLGAHAPSMHSKVGEFLATCPIDEILYFGNYYHELQKGFYQHTKQQHPITQLINFDSPSALLNFFVEHLQNRQVMTIKGGWSNKELDHLIKSLKKMAQQ